MYTYKFFGIDETAWFDELLGVCVLVSHCIETQANSSPSDKTIAERGFSWMLLIFVFSSFTLLFILCHFFTWTFHTEMLDGKNDTYNLKNFKMFSNWISCVFSLSPLFIFYLQPQSVKPTKYHFYPHNQHIYVLPECAIQQVSSKTINHRNLFG